MKTRLLKTALAALAAICLCANAYDGDDSRPALVAKYQSYRGRQAGRSTGLVTPARPAGKPSGKAASASDLLSLSDILTKPAPKRPVLKPVVPAAKPQSPAPKPPAAKPPAPEPAAKPQPPAPKSPAPVVPAAKPEPPAPEPAEAEPVVEGPKAPEKVEEPALTVESAMMVAPVSLHATPRPECNQLDIPLPGGDVLMLTNETGDKEPGKWKHQPASVAGKAAITKILELAPKGETESVQLSGATWFAVKTGEHNDDKGRMVYYEGPVVVNGMSFSIFAMFHSQDGSIPDEVRAALAQVKLVPPENPVEAKLKEFRDTSVPAAGRKDALAAFVRNEMPECPELLEELKSLCRETDDGVLASWCDAELRRLNPAVYAPGEAPEATGEPYDGGTPPEWDKTIAEMEKAPEVKIPEFDEEDRALLAAFDTLDMGMSNMDKSRQNLPRKKQKVSKLETVKPLHPEDFVNEATLYSAICNFRETVRMLIGNMAEEDQKRFDESFDAVLAYPAPEIVEWMKSAAPIVSELVRLRILIEESFVEFNEALVCANLARTAGQWDVANGWMDEISSIAAILTASKASMLELQAKMEELGPMPDPAKLRAAKRKSVRQSRKIIEELFAAKDAGDEAMSLEGEYLADDASIKISYTFKNGKCENESWRINSSEGASQSFSLFGPTLWEQPKIVILPVSEIDASGATHFYVYGEGKEHKDLNISFKFDGDDDGEEGDAKLDMSVSEPVNNDSEDCVYTPDGAGGFVNFDPASEDPEDGSMHCGRNRLSFARDPDGKRVLLCTTSTMSVRKDDDVVSTNFEYTCTVFRPTKTSYLRFPLKAGDKKGDTPEDRRKSFTKRYSDWLDDQEEYSKIFEKHFPSAPMPDSPAPYEVYYVLENVESVAGVPGIGKGETDEEVAAKAQEAMERIFEEKKRYMFTPGAWKQNCRDEDFYRPVMDRLNPRYKRVKVEKDSAGNERKVEYWAYDDLTDDYEEARKTGRFSMLGPEGTKRDTDGPAFYPHEPYALYNTAIQSLNPGCLKAKSEYAVYFRTWKDLQERQMDGAWADFTVEWLPPESVFRALDGKCRMPLYVTVNAEGTQHDPELAATNFNVSVSLERSGWVKFQRSLSEQFVVRAAEKKDGTFSERFTVGCPWRMTAEAGFDRHYLDATNDFYLVVNCGVHARNTASFFGAYNLGTALDRPVCTRFRFRRAVLGEEEMRELANSLDAVWRDAALKNMDEKTRADYAKNEGDDAGDDDGLEEPPANPEASKAESLAFHQENIRFINGTIDFLRREITASQNRAKEAYSRMLTAKTPEEAAKAQDEILRENDRIGTMSFSLITEQSNLVYEQDMIRAIETGEFHASRTPFDDYCQKQLLESIEREVNEVREVQGMRKRARYVMTRMDREQRAKAIEIYKKLGPADPFNREEWERFSGALVNIHMGNLEREAAESMLEVADVEEKLYRWQVAKTGSSIILMIGAMGAGTPGLGLTEANMQALLFTQFLADGYFEKGVPGAIESAVRFTCAPLDFVVSVAEGYEEGGMTGAAMAGGMALLFHVGIPIVKGNINMGAKSLREIPKGTFAKYIGKTAQYFRRPKVSVGDAKGFIAGNGGAGKGGASKGGSSKGKRTESITKEDFTTEEYRQYHELEQKAKVSIDEFKAKAEYYDQLAASKPVAYANMDAAHAKVVADYDVKLKAAHEDVVRAVAAINENPLAKAMLKGRTDQTTTRVIEELNAIKQATLKDYYIEMEKMGFKRPQKITQQPAGQASGQTTGKTDGQTTGKTATGQTTGKTKGKASGEKGGESAETQKPEPDYYEIIEIRNKRSGNSLGMDTDYGLNEEALRIKDGPFKGMLEPIVQNGKRVPLHVWQECSQKAYNIAYAKNTHGGDAEKAWILHTTSKYAEAYANPEILKVETGADLERLLRSSTISDAQQIWDVTAFKANEMIHGKIGENGNPFGRILGYFEASRGTAKDMGGKLIPAIDARLEYLQSLKAKGALPKGGEREITRLQKARKDFVEIYEVFNGIGKGEIPPEQWRQRFQSVLGTEKDVPDIINDFGHFFQSLVL